VAARSPAASAGKLLQDIYFFRIYKFWRRTSFSMIISLTWVFISKMVFSSTVSTKNNFCIRSEQFL
jgi:hypothetical protein